MPFSLFGFLIGRVLAEREGIADQSSQNRLALVGGLLGSSTTGLLVTTVLARREAESLPTTITGPVELVEVPNVKGMLIDEARTKMEKLGLQVQVKEVRSEIVEQKGSVITQDPGPSSIVEVGSTVTLFVSKVEARSSLVPVPDFDFEPVKKKFFTYDQARETLQDEDFKVTRRNESSSVVPKDTVIKTEPPANTLVEPESRVTVVVSSGPESQAASVQDVKAK
jgi:beta-lactam-binding protein with PASTA domain